MVRVELTVVDDKAAATWRARQTTAIRALLEWAAEQPNRTTTTRPSPNSPG